MKKTKKEFLYNINISLLSARGNDSLFFKYILVSNYKNNLIKKNALKLVNRGLKIKKVRKCCLITGRNKAVNRFTGISRIALRDLVSKGMLLGFKKSSW